MIKYFKIDGKYLYLGLDGEIYFWPNQKGHGYRITNTDIFKNILAVALDRKYATISFASLFAILVFYIADVIVTHAEIDFRPLISQSAITFLVWGGISVGFFLIISAIFDAIAHYKYKIIIPQLDPIKKAKPSKKDTPPFCGTKPPPYILDHGKSDIEIFTIWLANIVIAFFAIKSLVTFQIVDALLMAIPIYLLSKYWLWIKKIRGLELPQPPQIKISENIKDKRKNDIKWYKWNLSRLLGMFFPVFVRSPNSIFDALYFYGAVLVIITINIASEKDVMPIDKSRIEKRVIKNIINDDNWSPEKPFKLKKLTQPIMVYLDGVEQRFHGDYSKDLDHYINYYKSNINLNISRTNKLNIANLILIHDDDVKKGGSAYIKRKISPDFRLIATCGINQSHKLKDNMRLCFEGGLGLSGEIKHKENFKFPEGDKVNTPLLLLSLMYSKKLPNTLQPDETWQSLIELIDELSEQKSFQTWIHMDQQEESLRREVLGKQNKVVKACVNDLKLTEKYIGQTLIQDRLLANCGKALDLVPRPDLLALQAAEALRTWNRHDQSLVWYRKAASRGSVAAHLHLGQSYATGTGGVEINYMEAFSWYNKASQHSRATPQIVAIAKRSLGFMHEQGKGTKADPVRARALYREASDLGEGLASHRLGYMLQNGIGGPKDMAQAKRFYETSANQGRAEGNFNLGLMHLRGWGGLKKDRQEAIKLFKLAADKGFKPAVKMLKALEKESKKKRTQGAAKKN